MAFFLLGTLLLVLGYVVYGRLVANAVNPDPKRVVPAVACSDGVDFVVMPTWRVYLIQLLNIAGLGPIFGAIMGALWGPQVFLWIVLGSIFGGAVHDFLAGAMSMRNQGAGLPELIGRYLGNLPRQAATFFILGLMVLVGTVFVKGPAMLIAKLMPASIVGAWFGPSAAEWLSSPLGKHSIWLWIIMVLVFAYYVIATMLPIDRLIGRVYPIFSLALLVMVLGLVGAMVFGSISLPAFSLANQHPDAVPTWPIIFITVSCGAVSGFHATQSPLMARCLGSEKHMRTVFYGAMIAEGLIALVWASATQGYYETPHMLAQALAQGGPGQIVHDVCVSTMGVVGGALALLGVVVLPITSGDTAFRVGRLILADYLELPQHRIRNRYVIALPLFAVSLALNFVDFAVIWRYFGWANQTLAAIALWTGAIFLAKQGRKAWMAAVPALFMTVVTVTYILVEQHGFGLDYSWSVGAGLFAGVAALVMFVWKTNRFGSNKTDT